MRRLADHPDLDQLRRQARELAARILAFEAEYRRHPRPVRWKFTRQEFDRCLLELERCTQQLAA